MALVEKYYVVAAQYAIDPASATIKEGMAVTLTSAGVKATSSAGEVGRVLGIAGDTNSTSASSMPGVSSGWQNRVSDSFNETRASAKITVYYGGGEFATDQYSNTPTTLNSAVVGHYLKANTAGKIIYDSTARTADSLGILTRAAGTYPSGVPGTDINGDSALGGDNTNTYIEFKLII